ncbi:MAG: hypothetical protein ISR61_03805 [Desulfobacteraceae bacterium]|uniref:FeoB-associated Cys-rich membrane protein n=1 Tax=Candidatus Desulfacyla euxinica TaxID=2841693 RepID=A0A8J6N159_9DELT|nr:hypothetical protein [Candidatus Desulfacyla euxinica]MBL6978048.1 hypothetical protein [Desulfobacteraceae bacterium]
MIEIIITCFIVGLALIMTIRWLRKKVRGEAGDCCNSRTSSESSCGCRAATRGGVTNKVNGSIDCSFPREKG